MENKKELENPQAFPSQELYPDGSPKAEVIKGMDLRDYVAAKVLPSIVASVIYDLDIHDSVELSFDYADEFLKQRNK